MFTIKKIFFLFLIFITFSSGFSAFSSVANENNVASQEQLINRVEHLFQQNAESLSYDEVISLSNNITPNRINYPKDVIAKTYLLLANIALNKGEVETAFQFTQDGIAAASPQRKTLLCLQVKLAEILTEKKNSQKLLAISEEAIKTLGAADNTKYFLFALSYRSVAFAMLSKHDKALADLQQVQTLIRKNPAFSEHISLLSILANAYYYLGEYQTSLTMQLKILKLRFTLDRLENIDKTYKHLGDAYFNLQRYNDAYNAYWEAKQYAQKKSAPIYAAYAGQGLALALQHQKQYLQAKTELIKAQKTFYQHNLTTPYLETLISLAQISHEIKQFSAEESYLLAAEKISESNRLSESYIIFYQLLAQLYLAKNELKKAYFWQEKYSHALLTSKPIKLSANTSSTYEKDLVSSLKTKQLAIELAEKTELSSVFTSKYQHQQIMILILFLIIVSIIFCLILIWLKRRAKHSKNIYDEHDTSCQVLVNPIQTKAFYQTSFNMARKYSYPLTLSYISIGNWQELVFKFNKKVVNEVSDNIVSLINEHISEFENAGLINDGEYLLFFPHQTKEEAMVTIDKLLQALRLRFFANLGGVSVILSYSVESPDFQDIDPYIFLSQLSSAVKSI